VGRRGPAPKPTAIKRSSGNPGKRALNGAEPQFSRQAPPCPKHLAGEARKEWRRIVRELVQTPGLLQVVDRAALAAYCQAWARWVEAEQKMQAPDFTMIEVTDKGYAHVNPWFQVSTQAQKQMKAFLTEFGLTPASRARIQVAERGEEDEFDEFVRAKPGAKPGGRPGNE
jgi:P27 family predicted phage terminase small subunit